MTILYAVLAYLALSLAVSLFLGRFIAVGMGTLEK